MWDAQDGFTYNITYSLRITHTCKHMDAWRCLWPGITELGSAPPGMPELDEGTMERVLEEFEQRCSDNMNHAIETEEGLGIEYDEDVVCDVCQSPDGEDGNEMVFCDKCNICVHQVCGQRGPGRTPGPEPVCHQGTQRGRVSLRTGPFSCCPEGVKKWVPTSHCPYAVLSV